MTPAFPISFPKEAQRHLPTRQNTPAPVAELSSGVGQGGRWREAGGTGDFIFHQALIRAKNQSSPVVIVMDKEIFFYSFKLCSTNKICLFNVASYF